MRRFSTALAAMAVAASAAAGAASAADNAPYVVRGNTHMLIGVSLDEAALRAALPEGLEPTEGSTGGLQIYTSRGGEGVAPYARAYLWADLANFDSITGNPGRYILWLADTAHAAKMGALGYVTASGEVALSETAGALTGSATVRGARVVSASVKAGDCAAGTGVINYPSLPEAADGMAVTQYAFAGQFCGGELVGMEIDAAADPLLAKLNPQPAGWAAVARELSFSATPAMPLPAGE